MAELKPRESIGDDSAFHELLGAFYNSHLLNTEDRANDLIAHIDAWGARTAADPTQPWVSVEDSLPPIGTEVLVYRPGSERGKVTALARLITYEAAINYYWDNAYPGKGNMHLDTSITHWMWMPDGPIAAAPTHDKEDA